MIAARPIRFEATINPTTFAWIASLDGVMRTGIARSIAGARIAIDAAFPQYLSR